MGNAIVVVGSANADLVIHSDRIPKLGETLTGHDFQVNAGGKGLNQAVAIAKLGGEVSFLGAVGCDANAQVLLTQLRESGAEFVGFERENVPSGIAMITLVGGDNFIILNPGANETLTPEAVEKQEALIAQSDYCVMQLEIPLETVCRACEIAKKTTPKWC